MSIFTKMVDITVGVLDAIDKELDAKLLEQRGYIKATKEQELAQAIAEKEYILNKSKLNCKNRLSALEKLAKEAELGI